MVISTKDWLSYVNKLSKLNKEAAKAIQTWVAKNGFGDTDALIQYAYSVVTKYGEGAGELACQMYDVVADLEKATVPAAIPAETASYTQVANTVNATKQSDAMMEQAIVKLVKQVAADTMLQNAKRDGAYFAWIPSGDTCAFCLTLSAIGWQKAGKKTLRGTHAQHIHANCDCNYMIDFDGDMEIEGYNPEAIEDLIKTRLGYSDEDEFYLTDYLNGMWSQSRGRREYERLNVLRRSFYEERKDTINAQKRMAYARRKAKEDK